MGNEREPSAGSTIGMRVDNHRISMLLRRLEECVVRNCNILDAAPQHLRAQHACLI